MAAAIQHAAGGALLGAASSPAAADFTWRAVAAAAPRLLRLMHHQRHVFSSAPRALHTLLRRPSLPSAAAGSALPRPAAGASKQMPVMMGAASRSFSSKSNDSSKYANQLQDEEAKMKRKKALAEALMHDLPMSHPGAKDHGVEIKGISHLFSLLDVSEAAADATAAASRTTVDDAQVAELLGQVEKAKHALLIELLGDGPNRDQKKADLVDAGRRLLGALAALDERRALQNLYAELRSLQQRVASAEQSNKVLSEQVAAGKTAAESANANANSIRADVTRLGGEVTSIKHEAKAALTAAEPLTMTVEKLEQSVVTLEESVGKGRKEAEAAYGLALFVGSTGVVAAALSALNVF